MVEDNVGLKHHQVQTRTHDLRSRVPSVTTVPLASPSDPLAAFAVDPVPLIAPGQDAWEDVILDMFTPLLYENGRPRNGVELSQIIRRGDLGMGGFANFIERCLFVLNIPPGNFEMRIERIVQAMLLL